MDSSDQSISRSRLFIAGSKGGHSIAPAAHDYISKEFGKGWTMEFLEEPTPQAVMEVFRHPDFAGGVVTMPHKKTIMPYVDEVDNLAYSMGACNVISVTQDGKLHGTNTDCFGIRNALLAASPQRLGSVAMVYGAGGASRAAVYALYIELGYQDIYIINRDEDEASELEKDIEKLDSPTRPNLIHVKTTSQAKGLPEPTCIVSTVPDFEPKLAAEVEARMILAEFLSRPGAQKGVLLDMCYYPRTTRNIALASQNGWITVEGIQVVGHQLKLQWKLWTGEEISTTCEREAFEILEKCAAEDPKVTPNGIQLFS